MNVSGSSDSDSDASSMANYKLQLADEEDDLQDTSSHPAGATRNGPAKRYWTPAEDKLLRDLVTRHGARQWKFISSHFPNRSALQCRYRWTIHTNPDINKQPFSVQEDKLLIALVQANGSAWAAIAEHFPGRTDSAVKNRYYVFVRRGLYPAPGPARRPLVPPPTHLLSASPDDDNMLDAHSRNNDIPTATPVSSSNNINVNNNSNDIKNNSNSIVSHKRKSSESVFTCPPPPPPLPPSLSPPHGSPYAHSLPESILDDRRDSIRSTVTSISASSAGGKGDSQSWSWGLEDREPRSSPSKTLHQLQVSLQELQTNLQHSKRKRTNSNIPMTSTASDVMMMVNNNNNNNSHNNNTMLQSQQQAFVSSTSMQHGTPNRRASCQAALPSCSAVLSMVQPHSGHGHVTPHSLAPLPQASSGSQQHMLTPTSQHHHHHHALPSFSAASATAAAGNNNNNNNNSNNNNHNNNNNNIHATGMLALPNCLSNVEPNGLAQRRPSQDRRHSFVMEDSAPSDSNNGAVFYVPQSMADQQQRRMSASSGRSAPVISFRDFVHGLPLPFA